MRGGYFHVSPAVTSFGISSEAHSTPAHDNCISVRYPSQLDGHLAAYPYMFGRGMMGQYPFSAIVGKVFDRYGGSACSLIAAVLFTFAFGSFSLEISMATDESSPSSFLRLALFFFLAGLATVFSYVHPRIPVMVIRCRHQMLLIHILRGKSVPGLSWYRFRREHGSVRPVTLLPIHNRLNILHQSCVGLS